MRAAIILLVGWALAAAAQVDKSAEKPPLLNAGKPMVVDYHCGDEDIRSSGLSCTVDDPCPIFLELASVEAVGNRIFVAGNIHTSTITLMSVLLASDDEGKTWLEPSERIRSAGLDRIQFIDFENGWVGGEVQHPLPRDPFLLLSSDGGKTWRMQPVFGEPQFGSIFQFLFSSKTAGSLVIDRGAAGESGRYELFETSNAGESWMLRQANERPIPLKHAGAASDWRLRADATTKAYRIERHTGDAWHGVASFSVSLGVCRPPEMPVLPPAENTTPAVRAPQR